jgi:hypothetical protein
LLCALNINSRGDNSPNRSGWSKVAARGLPGLRFETERLYQSTSVFRRGCNVEVVAERPAGQRGDGRLLDLAANFSKPTFRIRH